MNIWTRETETKDDHGLGDGELGLVELKAMVIQLQQEKLNLEARNVELELGGSEVKIKLEQTPKGFYSSVAKSGPNLGQQGNLPVKYPEFKQTKLNIEKFDGSEVYSGLGSDFMEWGDSFVRQLVFAQRMCGSNWPEDVKIEVFRNRLNGVALQQFNTHWQVWTRMENSLLSVMNGMAKIFVKEITIQKGMELMRKSKSKERDWNQHYMYLTAVGKAMGGKADKLVIESLVNDACPELRVALYAKYDTTRVDYGAHALELAQYASKLASTGQASGYYKKSGVYHLKEDDKKSINCYACGELGHIARDCPEQMKQEAVNHMEMVLMAAEVNSIGELTTENDVWILDSGSSMHFVADKDKLINSRSVTRNYVMANNSSETVDTAGEVRMITSEGVNLRVQNVNYHPRMNKNLLSLGKLEDKGCRMQYEGDKRFLVSENGAKVFEVHKVNGIFYVRTSQEPAEKRKEVATSQRARNIEVLSERPIVTEIFSWMK
jgi:hypothetical protein